MDDVAEHPNWCLLRILRPYESDSESLAPCGAGLFLSMTLSSSKNPARICGACFVGNTGLEPVTSRVLGERSEPAELNALQSVFQKKQSRKLRNLMSDNTGPTSSEKCALQGLNLRPRDYESPALTN